MVDAQFQHRIAAVIRLAGGVSALAAASGLSARAIAKYRNGESDPSRERLVALARAGGVTVDWLATGDGPMRVGSKERAGAGAKNEEMIRAVAEYVLTADARATEPRSAEELADVIARFVAYGQKSGIDLDGWQALQTAVEHVIEFAPRHRAVKSETGE